MTDDRRKMKMTVLIRLQLLQKNNTLVVYERQNKMAGAFLQNPIYIWLASIVHDYGKFSHCPPK